MHQFVIDADIGTGRVRIRSRIALEWAVTTVLRNTSSAAALRSAVVTPGAMMALAAAKASALILPAPRINSSSCADLMVICRSQDIF
jgi:hypothetical protein